MICEALENGYCTGCDAAKHHYFKSEEYIEKNEFDYYENKKSCETLKKYRQTNGEYNDICKDN